jgi:hypothetical protein
VKRYLACERESTCAGSGSAREHPPERYQAFNLYCPIPAEIALCLYRVAQKALRNVGEHLGARKSNSCSGRKRV